MRKRAWRLINNAIVWLGLVGAIVVYMVYARSVPIIKGHHQPGEVKAKIVIYTKNSCSWCTKAKQFLRKKHLKFEEINLSLNPGRHMELEKETGTRIVPYIFINDYFIGNCADMLKMDMDGRLGDILMHQTLIERTMNPF